MPIYEYEAKTLKGMSLKGKLEAVSEAAAADALREKGYYPIRLRPFKASSNIELSKLQRVTLKDIAIFCRQFSVVINAGISVLRSLEIVKEQTENKRLKDVLDEVFSDVQKGRSLSDSMKRHSVFPDMLADMITVGESSGTLDIIFERMAVYYDKENSLNQKIKGAMTYPAAISIFAISVVILLVTKVLPTFVTMLSQSGTMLPLPTRILLGLSSFLTNQWYIVILIIIAVFFAYRTYSSSSQGRKTLDLFKMKAPIFGKLYSKILTARFARTFGTLMGSGVPLLNSIQICADVVGNAVIREALDSTTDELKKGLSVGETLTARGIFPVMLTQMIKIGEEAGTLDAILEKTASFYDGEVDTATSQLTALIEPVIIVILAVVVGFIIMSIILPMFSMYDVVNMG
ncbi:type II secretion system F family protein [Anoxybacterium hadale]|uniref:Type II secretion system F family protein n=1 Tax=Anoxybacterium hadale TaxID=3408580 RepID=A0ACD1A9E9_9FIRM|nr:type II secretion system F family protein [Clostridiales bacterium]